MEEEKVFRQAAESLSSGGKGALQNPPYFTCSDKIHEPFRLDEKPCPFSPLNDELFLWGNVSTTSHHFDGDRTDIHDTFSLVWAILIRAFGLSSPWLIDEPNAFGCDGELSGRYLIMQQCPVRLCEDNFSPTRSSLNAWTAFAFHLLEGVFDWESINRADITDYPAGTTPDNPEWISSLISYLKNPKDANYNHRRYPCWVYFSSFRKGVTVVRLPKARMSLLKAVLGPFHATTVKGKHALCVFGNGIPNAIPYSALKKSEKILSLINDTCDDPLIIPIDSHCTFLGDDTLLAIRRDCGKQIFEKERELLLERRGAENRVFFSDCVIRWKLPLNPKEFEALCLDILEREPSLRRAKPVGTIYNHDGGRDILIELLVPKPHDESDDTENEYPSKDGQENIGMNSIRVIVQVKSRKRPLGKADVQDIRDTIEHYEADGYILIAHPGITSGLFDHLETLRTRTDKYIRINWWEAHDLENRLRRHPDIIGRYPNLLEPDNPAFGR